MSGRKEGGLHSGFCFRDNLFDPFCVTEFCIKDHFLHHVKQEGDRVIQRFSLKAKLYQESLLILYFELLGKRRQPAGLYINLIE